MSTEQSIIKKRESTKRFDAIGKKINKLLTATAATFVPELANALKDDWYPHLSEDIIKVNKDAQDEIRDKILNQYAYQEKEGAPWSNKTIISLFPDWLKNPTMQESNKESIKAATAAAAYQRKIAQEHAIFERADAQLPEPPKTMQEQQEQQQEDEEPDQFIGEPLLREYGDKGESVIALYGRINGPARELFKGLTQREIPGMHDDLILDYLKPSREFRRGIFYEVDDSMRAGVYNTLVFVRDAINDTLGILDAIDKEEGQKKGNRSK